MARIANVDIPNNKHIGTSLTYIYGIGAPTARKICELAGVDPETRTSELTDDQLTKIRQEVANFKVEGDLRRDTSLDIKRLMEIGSYRGMRHRKGLPVRGQRTRTNARTRKGPVKTVANKKK